MPPADTIELHIEDIGESIARWSSYSFNSHFLNPSDAWTLRLANDSAEDRLIEKLVPGMSVTLAVNGFTQATGYVDNIRASGDRASGHEIVIDGRDRMREAVDCHVDPHLTFNAGQSLEDILKAIYVDDLGFEELVADNDASRSIKSGNKRGVPFTKPSGRKSGASGKTFSAPRQRTFGTGGRNSGPHPLKSFIAHQANPYPQESYYEFTARLANRFGLHIWPDATGRTVIVGTPDFDQAPNFTITLKRGSSQNNVIAYEVDRDGGNQPGCVVAVASGGGGPYDRLRNRVTIANSILAVNRDGTLTSEVAAVLAEEQARKARQVDDRIFGATGFYPAKHARPLYLRDDESKDLAQLEFFARRELSLLQRKALVCHYTVEGHSQNGSPWTVDTMVQVDDDYGGVHGLMYLLSRTFLKDRSGGTRTQLELILPGSLEFGTRK